MPASISHINQLPGQNIDEVHFLAVDSPMQWCNGDTPIPRISGSIPLEEPDKSLSKRFQNFQITRFGFGRFIDEMLNDGKTSLEHLRDPDTSCNQSSLCIDPSQEEIF